MKKPKVYMETERMFKGTLQRFAIKLGDLRETRDSKKNDQN